MATSMTGDDLYAADLCGVLDLEEVDTNLYRGRNTEGARTRTALYGGQVAAQALMAAGATVAPERRPHSLHGYFLRPGRVDRPIILHVDRDRDGGSFSARHVAARQDGEVIFSMLASFHGSDVVGQFDEMPAPDVAPPEACAPREVDSLVEIREVTRSEEVDGKALHSDCMWVRSTCVLPDDPLSQACGLTYLSDYGSGFGRQVSMAGRGGPSLDHAVWFHEPIRADEWVLLAMAPRKATSIRGVYDAAMRDGDGRLGAMVAQEHLLVER